RIRPDDCAAFAEEMLWRFLERPGIDVVHSHAALVRLLGFHDPERQEGVDTTRADVFAALTAQIGALAELRPVVLTLEDAHWADPSTLDLMRRILLDGVDWPLFVIAAARPPARDRLVAAGFQTPIWLGPLDARDLEDLAADVTGTARERLPAGFVADLQTRTGGSALLAEELCAAAARPGDRPGPLPAGLGEAVLSRFDGKPKLHRLAEFAACLGQIVDLTLLSKLAAHAGLDAANGVLHLAELGVVTLRGTALDQVCHFKHVLIRDAIYDAMAPEARTGVHADVVALIQAEITAPTPEALAYHAERSGQIALAIEALSETAQTLERDGALEEAEAQFRRAIELVQIHADALPDANLRELDLHLNLGSVLIALRGYAGEETGQTFDRARVLSERVDVLEQRLRALYGIAGYENLRENVNGALEITTDVVAFDTTKEVQYSLAVQGNSYTLSANGTAILTGTLQDYTAGNTNGAPNPYTTSNFIFLGDNTTSARGEFRLNQIALETPT
ncbi:MAG: hypothetical protein AAFR44_05675, partial [Pseudomonadota bacterium]